MIGVHDLGGVRGHGSVIVEAEEPVFHEPWEARVFANNICGGIWEGPQFRSWIERMPPVEYLATSYYEHWIFAMENLYIEAGVFTREELDRRISDLSRE